MARTRDSQRQKVYNAESVLRKNGLPGAERLETVAEMQDYVDHILKSAWFRRRWPQVARKGVLVADGRGRRIACATHTWGVPTIKMPLWSRSKAIIIHEVAHHCSDEAHGVRDVAAHGWQFASTLLELATHELGDESGDALKESYKAKKVRYKAPRKRKPLTDDQKAVLVERMAVARAARVTKIQSVEV